MSKYIIENKSEYYLLLEESNKDIANIGNFVMYIIKAVAETAQNTNNLILNIKEAILTTKKEMKKRLPDIYRYEIVEHLFSYLYTKTNFLEKI